MQWLDTGAARRTILLAAAGACTMLGISCADIFLAINPTGAEGQVCTGEFFTGEPLQLCRRTADGALGAFDVYMEDLLVDDDGDVTLVGSIMVGRAELSQTFQMGDDLTTVAWQLKDVDDTLLQLSEIQLNAEVAAAVAAGDAAVITALDFIEFFERHYALNSNLELAAEQEVGYGIDHFFECIATAPSERDAICNTLYDADRNGTLNEADYITLIAIVEGPEAAEDINASPVLSSATLHTFYLCSALTFDEENSITSECALIDLDRSGNIDDSDLFLLFDAGDTADAGENSSPVALAGSDRAVTSGDTVVLDGSESIDLESDASNLQYSWKQVRGPDVTLTEANSARPQFDAPAVDENSELEFELTVTDEGGLSDVDDIMITVQPVGPSADAGPDQQAASATTVTLTASGSSGTDIAFIWSQISGSAVTLSSTTTEQPVFSSPTLGEPTVLTFQVVVVDANGLQDSDTVDITVLASGGGGSSVSANAGADQQLTEAQLVTLDATSSTGDDLTFLWTQVSGADVTLSSESTAQPVFIAPAVDAPTTLRFRVTVTDGEGSTDSDEVDITILDGDA